MSKKSQKQAEKQILEIVNARGNNNKCGECGADYPTWALWNLGVLLCGRCANGHRKVLGVPGPRGGPVSRVKSLTLEQWSEDQIDTLRRGGNGRAQKRWNPAREPFPHDDDDDAPMEAFLRDKYIHGWFRDADDDAHSGYSAGSGRSRLSSAVLRGGGRPASAPVERLLHRKPTSREQAQFRAQASKIAAFGYADRDAVVESLVLSGGDLERALDILDHDARVNPSLAETPPVLPKRPSPGPGPEQGHGHGQGGFPETPATSAGSSETNWWAGLLQPAAQPAAQPQIYQYTDPVTGHVSYVDSSGQQYLDPSNPQHQLLLAQTSPQHLAQQATKQNILALYGQPDQHMTNVAAAQPPGYQQAQQQQQQLAPQFTQQLSQQATQQFPAQFQQQATQHFPHQLQQQVTQQFPQQAQQQATQQFPQQLQQQATQQFPQQFQQQFQQQATQQFPQLFQQQQTTQGQQYWR